MRKQPACGPTRSPRHPRSPTEVPVVIHAFELNPVLRGEVRIPNSFKDFWQPLLGHKAAATYAAILRFAYGGREECVPSISRLTKGSITVALQTRPVVAKGASGQSSGPGSWLA